MRNFSIEISVDKDGKIISLDTDDMEIYIYQETDDGMVRVLEITCDKPGGKVIGTLLTKVEFVGRSVDGRGAPPEMDINPNSGAMEIYSNRYGG